MFMMDPRRIAMAIAAGSVAAAFIGEPAPALSEGVVKVGAPLPLPPFQSQSEISGAKIRRPSCGFLIRT